MSSPEIWGPPLWRLLHSLAERLGKQTNMILITDEHRAWVNFLKSVGLTMPCQKCRVHYKGWTTAHRIERFVNCSTMTIRAEARLWVWGLHTEINSERGITSPGISEMPTLYEKRTSAELTADSEECVTAFKNALQHSLLPADALRNFRYTLSKLRASVG